MSRPADDALHSNARAPASMLAAASVVLCVLCGCKQQQSEQRSETSTPESSAQLDSASAVPASVPPDDETRDTVAATTDTSTDRVMTVRAVIASVPTQYSATFVANRLRDITELRDAAGRRAPGRYEFHGARLMRYSGELLLSPTTVELEFDLRGALLSSQTQLEASTLENIKTRSQLLRSHALAQQASRAH